MCRAVTRQVVGIIVAKLQESFDAGAAVVRPLTFQAVRKHQHQTGLLLPPLLSCSHSSVSTKISCPAGKKEADIESTCAQIPSGG